VTSIFKQKENKMHEENIASQIECLVKLQNSVKTLRDMKDVQCNGGTWNYAPYMHGMANGMIFALSLFDEHCPEYLEAPEEWLEDNRDKHFKKGE